MSNTLTTATEGLLQEDGGGGCGSVVSRVEPEKQTASRSVADNKAVKRTVLHKAIATVVRQKAAHVISSHTAVKKNSPVVSVSQPCSGTITSVTEIGLHPFLTLGL